MGVERVAPPCGNGVSLGLPNQNYGTIGGIATAATVAGARCGIDDGTRDWGRPRRALRRSARDEQRRPVQQGSMPWTPPRQ